MSASTPTREFRTDAVVVGGGPAGLSAAYWLARYARDVCVYDAGGARNRGARAVHGYPGLPDPTPGEFRRLLRAQAADAGARFRNGRIVRVSGRKDDFLVEPAEDGPIRARRVLLAYGVRDVVPDIPGLAEAYGTTAHHCPDCDGPDAAGLPVGVIGWTRPAAALALFLLTWAERVVLLSHGREPRLDDAARATLRRHGVALLTPAVARIHHLEGRIRHAELADGRRIPIRRLFFHVGIRPGSDLAPRLGCRTDGSGHILVDDGQESTVPGVYAAGDIAGRPYLAVAAAAEGVRAALSLHRSLLPPDIEL